MNHPLEGRNAVVCGSTQGIGRACAAALAEAGASITLVARSAEALTTVRDELPTPTGQSHGFIEADFSDHEGLREKATAHAASSGPVHILINNTGGPPAGPASEGAPEAYLDAFTKHILCNQVLMQAFVASMRAERYGRIINIVSSSVVTPIKGLGVSNTIRGAVNNWARTLAAELGPDGITVNNVLPGYVATARLTYLFEGRAQRNGTTAEAEEAAVVKTIPAGRLAEPEELGAVVAFLASPAAAYVSGVNLPVDGGRLATQ